MIRTAPQSRRRFARAYVECHWKGLTEAAGTQMPKLARNPSEYRLIAAWGRYRGHRLGYIAAMQQQAWVSNAPLDVIEHRMGRWVLVGELPKSLRKCIEADAEEGNRFETYESRILRRLRDLD